MRSLYEFGSPAGPLPATKAALAMAGTCRAIHDAVPVQQLLSHGVLQCCPFDSAAESGGVAGVARLLEAEFPVHCVCQKQLCLELDRPEWGQVSSRRQKYAPLFAQLALHDVFSMNLLFS